MLRTLYSKLAVTLAGLFALLGVALFVLLQSFAAAGQPAVPMASYSTALAMTPAMVLALVMGLLAVGITRRLDRLIVAMETFRASDFTERVPYATVGRPGDEIDRLGRAYNEMAERIVAQLAELRQADALRRDLIANVSHDLRTPLASLRGYLDTLLLKGDSVPAAERRHHLEVAARQSERLGKLVGEFFELAKLDAGDVEINTESFVLGELVQDVLQQFELAARAKAVRLAMERGAESGFVRADLRLIERMLENLIENAIRHTPPGGAVIVSLTPVAGAMRVAVADTGNGIPAAALPHIFERCYTVEKSRTERSGGGSGLGLAITKRIVELHQGILRVESTVGQGTRFWFDLPADDPVGHSERRLPGGAAAHRAFP